MQQPEVAVFDEATSTLDQVSENFIQDSIRNLFNDETIIIVSHRLSSVLISDKVVVLKDKVIAGIGHHKELLVKNPAYDELFSVQLIS